MFRKVITPISLFAVLIVVSCLTVVAQTAPLGGRVTYKDPAGKEVPIAGATVDLYPTEVKGPLPTAKTDKSGQFHFAGVLIAGTFIISVSVPGYHAEAFPNIHAGNEDIKIWMDVGDGARLTEDQARQFISAPVKGQPTELSADQKKAQADNDAKVKAVEAKNAEVKKTTDVVNAAFKAGGDAYTAKNYDLAIAKFTEGIDADPNFAGSAIPLYRNRGMALTKRAYAEYNAVVKEQDVNVKIEGYGKAKKDLAGASEGYLKALQMAKANTDPADKASMDADRKGVLEAAIDTFEAAAKTEQADPVTVDAAKALIPEYQNTESDNAKKVQASLIMADLYRVTNDSDNAVAAYKKVLETSPDNIDALAGAGLSLINQGFAANDKAKLQEGADLLQKFVTLAPDTHPLKVSVADSIKYLKEQNITPQKIPATGGKKRGS